MVSGLRKNQLILPTFSSSILARAVAQLPLPMIPTLFVLMFIIFYLGPKVEKIFLTEASEIEVKYLVFSVFFSLGKENEFRVIPTKY
jgi:hypothetical protein